MNIVDPIIVLLVLGAGYLGYKKGLVQTGIVFLSVIIGLVLGSRFSLLITKHIRFTTIRAILSVLVVVVISAVLVRVLDGSVQRIRTRFFLGRLYKPDKYAGCAFGLVAGLAACWFSASLLFSQSSLNLANLVLTSKVMTLIDNQEYFGHTAYDVFYGLIPDHKLNARQIWSGQAPYRFASVATSQPFSGPFAQAVAQDYPSVVRVLGVDSVCFNYSELSSGSGYVAFPHIIVTAAHVVAGSDHVVIQTVQNKGYLGSVVYLNAKEDFAMVDAPTLPISPIPLDPTHQHIGTPVATLGFPEGGHFEYHGGVIQSYYPLHVNGFGNGSSVYGTSAAASEGSSGGPLINLSGAVVGHITRGDVSSQSFWGSSNTSSNNTYAAALNDYYEQLISHARNPHRVSTGSCSLG